MYRLSLIISEIYNKYLPLAEKDGVALNLDFSDTTQTVADPDAIKESLDQHLSSALSRSERGEISIAVESDAIIITDSGTTLSKPLCALLSKGRVSVVSRVGFGTTVRISLQPSTDVQAPLSSQPSVDPKPPKSKSPTKPTREQRKIAAAAKKADRKIQKLRRSQQAKQTKLTKKQPQSKKPKSANHQKQKPKSSRKKVIELS